MLYSEIIAVCSQIHTKHKITVGRRRIVNVKLSVHIVTTGLLVANYDKCPVRTAQ
jgi:hypothetical protein